MCRIHIYPPKQNKPPNSLELIMAYFGVQNADNVQLLSSSSYRIYYFLLGNNIQIDFIITQPGGWE